MSPARGGAVDYLNKLDSAWITRSMGVTSIASLDPEPGAIFAGRVSGTGALASQNQPDRPKEK
jgi:hypothetical protein